MASKPASGFLPSLMSFLALSGGREKSCRLIQYFCKFLASKYQEQYQIMIADRNLISSKKAKAESLMGAAGMARKILRFGPSINLIITLVNNLNDIAKGNYKEPLIIMILKTLSAVFIGMFFVCDHYLWLFKMGLATDDKKRAFFEYWSIMGWFLDCINGIIKDAILFGNATTPKEQKPIVIDMIRYLLDFVLALSFLKPGTTSGKTMGLLGTTTSLIGIYQMWK